MKTRAFVLHPHVKDQMRSVGARTPQAHLDETVGLALALDLDVLGSQIVMLSRRRASALFGAGKIEELGRKFTEIGVELVVVDGIVSPIQQRNLEREWKLKILDRTGLILEIFGDRARTREGVLQVDLAHLTYQKSRLVRSWTHLERQRGGVGFMGGPGETQIEADRRMIDEKIIRLRRQLAKVARTRALHREARKKIPYPIVALVGYTNAGKSTIFNRLCNAGVLAKDMLFATLDPTMRAIETPSGGTVILSDTVGFISNLPTQLVAAFRATLEEVLEADLIIHVRDIAHKDAAAQKADVLDVLNDLGVPDAMFERMIEARNKIDLLSERDRQAVISEAGRGEGPTAVSAVSGEGVADLLGCIGRQLDARTEILNIALPSHAGEALAWLYERGVVLERDNDEDRVLLKTKMSAQDKGQFLNRFQMGLPESIYFT